MKVFIFVTVLSLIAHAQSYGFNSPEDDDDDIRYSSRQGGFDQGPVLNGMRGVSMRLKQFVSNVVNSVPRTIANVHSVRVAVRPSYSSSGTAFPSSVDHFGSSNPVSRFPSQSVYPNNGQFGSSFSDPSFNDPSINPGFPQGPAQSPGDSSNFPSIPVATGGLHPPPGHNPLNDVFVINDYPLIIDGSQRQPSQGSSSLPNHGSSGFPIRGSGNQGSSFNFQGNSGFQGSDSQPSFGVPSNNPTFNGNNGNRIPSQNVPSSTSSTPVDNYLMQGIANVVGGIKDFSLDLLSTFRAVGKSGNIVFSPVSIASLLSLLTLGAKGISKQEIDIALNLPPVQNGISSHHYYQQILERTNLESEGVNITTASRLFIDNSVRVKDSFIGKAGEHYNCSVSSENFRGSPTRSKDNINRWVEEQTKGKIRNFISSPIPASTRMILANTIYFSGAWETPFPEYITAPGDFNTGRKTVKIPMMTNVLETPYYFSSVLNVEVVALRYSGGQFAMVIILPKEEPNVKSIEQLESQLDAFYVDELLRNLTTKQVSIALPKMKLSMKAQLKQNLGQLSISGIFNSITSDFSDLSDDKPLFVNQFLHDAVMEVNEQGTVAAGASGVMLDRLGGFPRIVVDKPAIISIMDMATGLPLFWTRLVEPVPL